MKEIEDDLRKVMAQEDMRQRDKVKLALDAILGKVVSHKNEVEEIISTNKSVKAMEVKFIELVTNEVSRVVDGNLCVMEYCQKAKSKQQVYLYDGFYWRMLDIQEYYDFCRDATQSVGIPTLQWFSVEFMCRVFEQIAFTLSKHQRNVVPDGEVWINMRNGTLEIQPIPPSSLHEGEGDSCLVRFREHRKEDFFLYCLNYDYDPVAECPGFRKFLDRVLPENEAQMSLMEYIGSAFSMGLRHERMCVLAGGGANGKSVFLEIVSKLYGNANVSNIGLSELTTDPEKRSLMEGKLANISHESNKMLDTSILKKMISGEPVDVRILYRGTHIMERYGRLFTSFNILPPAEHSYGYFRRWNLYPFNVTIPEREQDVNLAKKLCQELPGIMNWVLESLQRLMAAKSFTQSAMCNDALNEYKRTSNSALLFISEKCVVDDSGRMKLKELYQAYNTFCCEEGVKNRFGKAQFRRILENWGAASSTYCNSIYYNVKMKGEE